MQHNYKIQYVIIILYTYSYTPVLDACDVECLLKRPTADSLAVLSEILLKLI